MKQSHVPASLGFCLGLLFCLTTQAAAPTMNSLYPMGGQVGTTVSVEIDGKVPKENVSFWCSREDLQIEPGEKPNLINITIPESATPGIAWLRLYNTEGASKLRPFQIGVIPEQQEKENNNEFPEAQSIPTSPILTNGMIRSGNDVDMFKVELQEGETLVSFVQANYEMGSPMDPVLQVLSSRGFVLQQNEDDHGLDPLSVFIAPKTDTYYLRLFAFPAKTNQTINFSGSKSYVYRLTTTTGPFVDHVVPMAVSSSEGSSSSVRLFGWNLPPELHDLPVTPLPEGKQALLRDPALANVVELDVVDSPLIVEREPNDKSTPQIISLPAIITGQIHETGDRDLFEFEAKKNETWTLKVVSRELGFPLDPYIRIYNQEGKKIREVDDIARAVVDVNLDYKFPADGKYTIEVSDRFNNSGYRFMYRLEITKAVPEYEATVAATQFTLTGKTALEIPVKISRKRGYAEELRFEVSGLSEKIKLTAPSSESKGDSSKEIKLVLTSPRTFTGSMPVQITAIAVDKSGKETRQPVLATVADRTQKTDTFWLTAVAGKTKPAVKAEKP